jgi:shikimate dehydrogenase
MIIYGLIGYPLLHSESEAWFAEKLRKEGHPCHIYANFPLKSLNEFPPLFCKHTCLKGLNVTMPYKEEIIPWLEELDPAAQKIGAVNTVLIRRERGNVHLRGFNTDSDGFMQSADFSGHSNALILGTGGAAKAVGYALQRLGISFQFVSRNKSTNNYLTYQELTKDHFASNSLIVNATPSGMIPENSFPPIPYQFLSKEHFLYDLVYFPSTTKFLKYGSEAGCRIQNGYKMLERQAELSYRIWNR